MNAQNTESKHGNFWRCTLPDGTFVYYEESTPRQIVATQDVNSAPTIVKGFAVYDSETYKILDVLPTKEQATEIVNAFESSKIVNVLEPSPPETEKEPADDEYPTEDVTDRSLSVVKVDKRSGRKPVRGSGSSGT